MFVYRCRKCGWLTKVVGLELNERWLARCFRQSGTGICGGRLELHLHEVATA